MLGGIESDLAEFHLNLKAEQEVAAVARQFQAPVFGGASVTLPRPTPPVYIRTNRVGRDPMRAIGALLRSFGYTRISWFQQIGSKWFADQIAAANQGGPLVIE